jgi:hypothetical protein
LVAESKVNGSGSYLHLGEPGGQAVKMRIAPQMRLQSISVMFDRTRYRRFITITKSNRPETAASPHVSGSEIERCFDSIIVGQNLALHVTP